MCQSWEFGCGHITETFCQSYKNGTLIQSDTRGASSVDEDPFTDGGNRLSSTEARLTRAHSGPTPTTSRLAPFMLPPPTGMPLACETPAPLPTHSMRRRDSMFSNSVRSGFGPGPAVESNDGSSNLQSSLPPALISKIKRCNGPNDESKTITDPCYACILKESKSNSAFQKNERDAETRLHHEVSVQHGRATERDRYHDVHDDDSALLRFAPNNSANVDSVGDPARGHPAPRAGRVGHRGGGFTSPSFSTRGGSHQHQHRHHPPHGATQFLQPAQSPFLDRAKHQPPSQPSVFPAGFNPSSPSFTNPATFQQAGPLARYAAQNQQQQSDNVFQQHGNPYQPSFPPYGTQMAYDYENPYSYPEPDMSYQSWAGYGGEGPGLPQGQGQGQGHMGQRGGLHQQYGYFPRM